MKYALLLLAVLAAGNVFSATLPARSFCKAKVANATDNLLMVNDRLQVGEVTLVDVDEAKLALLDIQLTCGDIVRGDASVAGSYCAQENQNVAKEYVEGIQSELQVGQRTNQELREAMEVKLLMDAICAP